MSDSDTEKGDFINAEQKEEFDMLAKKNIYIDNTYQHMQVISQDKDLFIWQTS